MTAPVAALAALLTAPTAPYATNAAAAAQSPPTPERLEAAVTARAPAAFDLFGELLAFPNDANHPGDIARLTDWLDARFAERGFATERLEMQGSDALLATREVPGAARTVLVYLQADGQPVDPSAWHQESPWTPTLKARRPGARSVDGNPRDWETLDWERLHGAPDPEWRIFARSASDSKGPVAQFLVAMDVLADLGVELPYTLKVIVDTEEEMGSPHLAAAVERYQDRLAADWFVIFDGPPHVSGEPSLVFGARGIATLTLTTYGPRVAQHSGHWGNWVPNPALGLAQLLAGMKDERGRVTIPGFYDGVEIDDATRAILEAVPDDVEAIHDAMGIARGDAVASSPQAALQYPSLNIRGLRAAWVGDEVRTIIPPTAVAELDVRLVMESDPERLIGLVRGHVERAGYHVVEGRDPTDDERRRHPKLARLDASVSYRAFRTDFAAPPALWLRAGMDRLFGQPPIMVRTFGGSIPISPFVTTLGVPAVQVGTVNPDNNQHSPNENLRVFDFLRGIRIIAGVLSEPLP